jgi:hypothetical protein
MKNVKTNSVKISLNEFSDMHAYDFIMFILKNSIY